MTRPNYTVFDYTLAPGQTITVHHPANSLNCLAADARFQIAFDDAPLTTFEKGIGYKSEEPFKKIRIHNDGASQISVELGFARGGVTDSRLNIAGSLNASIFGGATATDATVSALATAETVVAAASLTRNEILITNEGTKTVYLGGVGITANKGLPLAAGATATLQTTAAISVYNPDAAAQALAVLELLT